MYRLGFDDQADSTFIVAVVFRDRLQTETLFIESGSGVLAPQPCQARLFCAFFESAQVKHASAFVKTLVVRVPRDRIEYYLFEKCELHSSKWR
jgi:hypothetical protein